MPGSSPGMTSLFRTPYFIGCIFGQFLQRQRRSRWAGMRSGEFELIVFIVSIHSEVSLADARAIVIGRDTLFKRLGAEFPRYRHGRKTGLTDDFSEIRRSRDRQCDFRRIGADRRGFS